MIAGCWWGTQGDPSGLVLPLGLPDQRTYEAMPHPKLVVAVGDCGRDGGIFGCSYASLDGVSSVIPVDVVAPGCPPFPRALLQGLIMAVQEEHTP